MTFSSELEIKIKKSHPDAVIPTYANPGDAGLDLVCVSRSAVVTHMGKDTEAPEYFDLKYREVYPEVKFVYNTGLSLEIPEGYYGKIVPRSSIHKKNLILCNHSAVIDSGYRGELKLFFKAYSLKNQEFYEVGDKVGQLLILPYPKITFKEVKKLEASKRGTAGFGSTGK